MIRPTANETRLRMINSITDNEMLTQSMYMCAFVYMRVL